MKRALGALLIAATLPACQTTVSGMPDYIKRQHAQVLGAWLQTQKMVRVANDQDCGSKASLARIRSIGGEPDYHPYYCSGDFNGDGREDFAVILLGPQSSRQLVVFNGPHSVGAGPCFIAAAYGELFLKTNERGSHRLLVGEFDSEGESLEPVGKSYEPQPPKFE